MRRFVVHYCSGVYIHGPVPHSLYIADMVCVFASIAASWESLKKAEIAALAERETAGTVWLPELLRKAA